VIGAVQNAAMRHYVTLSPAWFHVPLHAPAGLAASVSILSLASARELEAAVFIGSDA
jgi:hypothetical protein